MIKGITEQRITQGKTFPFRLRFKAEDVVKINKIWFTCRALSINKEMSFDSQENIYFFELSWRETQVLQPMNTTFNVTIQFIGEREPRDLANGIPLTVVKNSNPVNMEV